MYMSPMGLVIGMVMLFVILLLPFMLRDVIKDRKKKPDIDDKKQPDKQISYVNIVAIFAIIIIGTFFYFFSSKNISPIELLGSNDMSELVRSSEHKLQSQTQITMQGIQDKVANDAVNKYNIVQSSVDLSTQQGAVALCVQAGMVSAAMLQASNQTLYKKWKDTENKDCKWSEYLATHQ